MPKLPFMKFYTRDWIADTRHLTPAERGHYVDLMCLIWDQGTRGTLTIALDELAQFWHLTIEAAPAMAGTLFRKRVIGLKIHPNGDITLLQRRIERDQNAYASNNERQKRWYERHKNGDHNGNLTPKKPEARSQRGGNTGVKDTPVLSGTGAPDANANSNEKAPPSDQNTPPDAGAPAAAGTLNGGPTKAGGVETVDESPIVFTFPVKAAPGQGILWALHQSKVDEYTGTFGPGVAAELMKARQWCVDNPTRQKTARGMPKFLFGWLERKNNRGHMGQGAFNGQPRQDGFATATPGKYAKQS